MFGIIKERECACTQNNFAIKKYIYKSILTVFVKFTEFKNKSNTHVLSVHIYTSCNLIETFVYKLYIPTGKCLTGLF